MLKQGLPVTYLLLFTMLIWGLYLMVLLSSRKNKVNQWCCITGFLLSIGVLKEYIYFSGFFAGMQIQFLGAGYQLDELVNSILTAIIYYLAIPCGVVCSLYFCRIDRDRPRLFHILKYLVFLPAVIFSILYPWGQTRDVVSTNPEAFTIVAVYNLVYGAVMTVLIVMALVRTRNTVQFHQRKQISLFVLLPLWYWLIMIFLVHMLKLEKFYKLWQGNVLIILCLCIYYLYLLFNKGIWGLRLNRQYFDWSEEEVSFPEDVRYIIHMLKNETAKLRLGARLIRELDIPEAADELDIMERSITHIDDFVQRSNLCSRELQIEPEYVEIQPLFEAVAAEAAGGWKGTVRFHVEKDASGLYCDLYHMKEVLCNLTANALDAMGENGILTFAFQVLRKELVLIRVSDTGCGIPEDKLEHILDLYYTGHSDYSHFGLGLAYCRAVIKQHNGYMEVKSSTDPEKHGTEFTLCLPRRYRGVGKS
ncbi:MAG: HAMP domain-containing histidine kinase [Ruminococcus sp.]|nr:HAMP domain-containing histidine kinase [Ruminococcus sp.]